MKTNVSTMSEKPNLLYVCLDIHKKQWSVCIRTEEFEHRTFQQPADPGILHNYLKKHFSDYKITCAYEAGCFGYWISEQLQSYGYRCLILNPADIPGRDKEDKRKTDHNDCRKIARELSKENVNGIYQPDKIQQSFRGLFGHRNALVKNLRVVKCRIRSMLSFNGIQVPGDFENNNWSRGFRHWLMNLQFENENTRTT